jgi:hypothetical protein
LQGSEAGEKKKKKKKKEKRKKNAIPSLDGSACNTIRITLPISSQSKPSF